MENSGCTGITDLVLGATREYNPLDMCELSVTLVYSCSGQEVDDLPARPAPSLTWWCSAPELLRVFFVLWVSVVMAARMAVMLRWTSDACGVMEKTAENKVKMTMRKVVNVIGVRRPGGMVGGCVVCGYDCEMRLWLVVSPKSRVVPRPNLQSSTQPGPSHSAGNHNRVAFRSQLCHIGNQQDDRQRFNCLSNGTTMA